MTSRPSIAKPDLRIVYCILCVLWCGYLAIEYWQRQRPIRASLFLLACLTSAVISWVVLVRGRPRTSLFTGVTTIGVREVAAATAWYKEKFELREWKHPDPEYAQLKTQEGEFTITLCSGAQPEAPPPVISTDNVGAAMGWLVARGVNVTPVQTDRQGIHYIEMRDLENNLIEIAEEP